MRGPSTTIAVVPLVTRLMNLALVVSLKSMVRVHGGTCLGVDRKAGWQHDLGMAILGHRQTLLAPGRQTLRRVPCHCH